MGDCMPKKSIPLVYDQSGNYYQKKIGGFFVSKNTISNNFRLHQHDFYELEYIIDGNGTHYINGDAQNVKKGDMIFVTPLDFHGYETKNLKTLTCHFYQRDLSFEVSQFLHTLKADVLKNVDTYVTESLEYMSKVFEENKKFAELKLKNLIEIILLDLFKDKSNEYENGPKDRISAAIGYININFQNEITLNLIEEKFGVSKSYFSREFKNRTGKCFCDYVCQKRLELAKKLLKNGNLVIDACFESGFGGVRNFNRQFKKFYGVTPKQFAESKNKS